MGRGKLLGSGRGVVLDYNLVQKDIIMEEMQANLWPYGVWKSRVEVDYRRME